MDKDFFQNIPMTQTERITMASRPKQPKYARNKNILVIGGSGSGKTRFFCKPSLLQAHSSYVCTDPKGTLLPEIGAFLERKKYRIKCLNLINFRKSMKYNPLAYIRSEKDILKLVNALIMNTKGEGEKSSEDFWVKAERLYYSALIGYIWYEATEEEKNFITLLDLINASEAREDDETYQSPVDLLFSQLEEREPDHFAVKQYRKFKMAAGVVCSKRLLNQAVGKSLRTHNLKPKKGAQVMRKNEKITALYERLSRDDFGKDDDQQRESNSISNQKKILERYCKDHGITAYRHYDEDDGYSGTNFNRPGFQRMLADIKAGRIKRVIVKDMSRFGRDYLQVGMYTDVVFPEFGVHFIAVNDGVDSTRGESEFTAIRNVFNEMYARDTSKKIRATWQSKGKSGEHLTTIPPYGYMKSPEDKKKWIVDEEAAAVVQKIFSLCASGKGPTQIAKWLKQQQILNPTAYCHAKGLPTSNKPTADPYKWTNETVSRILERVDYLGHTVNFKTTKKSYKSKKKIWNDPENWVIFENTQPPIIEESVFLIVQNIRKARRRPTKMGEMGMFSGLLYCAEYGGKMYQCRATNFAENQKYFICSTYRKGKDLCTTHSIKNVVLHEIVLRNLREAISYVSEHEAEFIQDAAESDMRDRDAEFVRKRETLAKADTRIAELDRIISRLYEDNVIGKLSDERFIKMSHDYELEQSNLKSMADVLRKDLKQQEQQKTNVKAFIAAVKKYTDLQELDAAVLRAFIDRIEVSHVDKKSRTREITIVYNFIGAFDFTRAIENARNISKKEQRTA